MKKKMNTMKNDFTKTNLFACPIYKIRIDPNSYDKEKIINDIKYNKSLENTRNEPHQNIGGISDTHHSYRDFDNENFRPINYEKLITVYLEIFKEFLEKQKITKEDFSFNFNIVNYSAITEGQWLPVHNHMGSGDDFACIHYLNFKNDHNQTNFKNPAIFAPFAKYIQPELSNMLDDMVPDNSYFWEYFKLSTEEDDMFIFPSMLGHEVVVQGPTKEPRISISTNIKIKQGT
jgi:hypothetical protein